MVTNQSQTMGKIDQQHKNILKAGKHFDMSFARIANDMENRLKKMGIELPNYGPRILDQAHVRGRKIRDQSKRQSRGVRCSVADYSLRKQSLWELCFDI